MDTFDRLFPEATHATADNLDRDPCRAAAGGGA
jgi:hypothetical protein